MKTLCYAKSFKIKDYLCFLLSLLYLLIYCVYLSVHMSITVHTFKDSILLVCDSLLYANEPAKSLTNISPNVFNAEYLLNNGLIEKELIGRGKVYFVRWQEHLLALRNYYRGGAIAKLSEKRFLYTGLKRTRCYQELEILEYLSSKGLNVPRPVAALVRKFPLSYEASILTQVIDNAVELDSLLAQEQVEDAIWYTLGQEIRKMHDLQVCHYDLNVKNILLQSTQVYLIDFDKCLIKQGHAWKQGNLQRLKRSLLKQQALQTNYHFEAANFERLLMGYKGE